MPAQQIPKNAKFGNYVEPQSESNESGMEHLNTAEKQKLKREMMMMGYDEDSYGEDGDGHDDEEEQESANYIVEDDNSAGMTDEQLFKE